MLTERWDGVHWAIVSTTQPPQTVGEGAASVSCPSARVCFAAGSLPSSAQGFVERFDGSAYTLMKSPAGSVFLNAIACRSAVFCVAVGQANELNSPSFAQRWNGHVWSRMKMPTIAGATEVELLGVDCATTTSCYADGLVSKNSALSAIIEHWNGSTWSISPATYPAGRPLLNAVTCRAPSACIAVGSVLAGGPKTLVMRLHGSSWSADVSPNPAGSTRSILYGAACPNPTHCVAVGEHYTKTSPHPLIEQYGYG